MERLSARINLWLQRISGVVLVAIMMITVVDVVSRWLLNQPVEGTVELTGLAMVVIVFLALGGAEHHGGHISIDLVFERLPKRWRRALQIFVGLVSFLLLMVIAWQLYIYAGRLEAGGYITGRPVLGLVRVPTYPLAFVAVAGILAYALAVLSNVVALIRDPTLDDANAPGDAHPEDTHVT